MPTNADLTICGASNESLIPLVIYLGHLAKTLNILSSLTY